MATVRLLARAGVRLLDRVGARVLARHERPPFCLGSRLHSFLRLLACVGLRLLETHSLACLLSRLFVF